MGRDLGGRGWEERSCRTHSRKNENIEDQSSRSEAKQAIPVCEQQPSSRDEPVIGLACSARLFGCFGCWAAGLIQYSSFPSRSRESTVESRKLHQDARQDGGKGDDSIRREKVTITCLDLPTGVAGGVPREV